MQQHLRPLDPEKIEARVTRHIAASPARIFDAFIRPDLARRWREAWLNSDGGTGRITRFSYDPRVGGRYAIEGERDGRRSRSWGTFLVLQRPNRVCTIIVHASEEDDPSVLDIFIERDDSGRGSLVTACNELGDEWSDWLAQIERTWMNMLVSIELTLSKPA